MTPEGLKSLIASQLKEHPEYRDMTLYGLPIQELPEDCLRDALVCVLGWAVRQQACHFEYVDFLNELRTKGAK